MGQHHHFADHLANMRNTFLLVLLGFVGLAISVSQEDEQTKELEDELYEDRIETWGELEELEELTEESDRSQEISRTERDADPEKKKGRKQKNGKGNAKKSKTRSGKSRGKKNKSEWGNRTAKSSKSGSKTKGGKGKNKIGNKKRQGNRKAKSSKRQTKSGKNQKNKSSKPKKKGRKPKKPSTKQNTKAKTQRKSGKIQPAGDERIACSRAVNSTCLDTAVKLLKIVNSRVTNFLIQQKRMSKYNSTGGKKSGKKGLFGPIASKVIDVGGGNASVLSCSGNK